tara:strand:- start:133 stop:291 length:159 start_codon:yes stop_codon:yes gene_type:complete
MTESNEYLTQEEIDKLSPEDYSFYLAHGRLPYIADQEIEELFFRESDKFYDV